MLNTEKDSSGISKSLRDAGPYIGLGTQLAATITVMFFVGWWLDNHFETKPIFIIACTFFGGFAGIYNFIKTVINLNKTKKNEKNS